MCKRGELPPPPLRVITCFMKYRWILRPLPSTDVVADVRRALNDLPEALARALVLRGIDTFESARLFFRPSIGSLHDPFLMKDMDAAADRLVHALDTGEKILVYGDYDVDGTTATALLVSALRGMGGDVDYFIPDRLEHGYGLCEAGIEHAADTGARVVLAVDCGVTALKEARFARERGLDLIICDHHTPKEELPDAIAVLDPKRPDCAYPFKELCGCAVAYKLVRAMLQRLGKSPNHADAYLDLVALATASDIVPVQGENRILLACGLEALQASTRVGICKLAEIARLDLPTCTGRDIVFGIGPRINAAGRLGDAGRAVALLLEQDAERAGVIAAELERVNGERRTIDQGTLDSAIELAERQLTSRTRHAIVLHHPDWHLGVIGIVASRLVDRFYRPTILLGTSNGYAKGSARSIAGINIYNALHACEDLLVQFGGHDFAAGMTLRIEDIPAFQERLDEAVGQMVTADVLHPAINVDAHLDLADIDTRFWAVLKQFAPFGPENDRPVFRANRIRLSRPPRTVGRGGKHLKFSVRQDEAGSSLDAIGFGLGERSKELERSWKSGEPFDLLFNLDENTWNGRTTLQIKAKDLRPSSEQA